MEAKRTRHAVSNITYPLVRCSTHRRKAFSGRVAQRLGERIRFKVAGQTSTRLVSQHSLIAVEDVNVQGLCRSPVSKSTGDAAWGQLLDLLAYQAEKAGTLAVRLDPHGTSQICSGCDRVVSKTLAERRHSCPHCVFTAPRDVNAALNVLSRGRAQTGPARKGFLGFVRAGVAGCPLLWAGEGRQIDHEAFS